LAAKCWSFPALPAPAQIYGNCGNIETYPDGGLARTISLNGTDISGSCGAWPHLAPRNGGYCVVWTAGTYSYAYWGSWSY
jgi:hypothetical protein